MWICIALSRNNLASKALSVTQVVTEFYLPPNTSSLYYPAAEHHRPLPGTHCVYPRRDGRAELTWVVG